MGKELLDYKLQMAFLVLVLSARKKKSKPKLIPAMFVLEIYVPFHLIN